MIYDTERIEYSILQTNKEIFKQAEGLLLSTELYTRCVGRYGQGKESCHILDGKSNLHQHIKEHIVKDYIQGLRWEIIHMRMKKS